jgi:hypothetical protein
VTTLTYTEELTRKTLETVERLALRHEQGVLTDKQFRIALDVVWDCTSGLVDEIGPLMEDAVEMGLTPEREQIVVSNGALVIIINRHNTTVTRTNALTKVEGNLMSFFTEGEAVDHVRKLVAAFKTKGFTVL